MSPTFVLDRADHIDALVDHIQERTYRRLHDLIVVRASDGRIRISAVAHSRFVGQLAEWAVLDRVVPEDVDLSICVSPTFPQFAEVPS